MRFPSIGALSKNVCWRPFRRGL